jgi:PIN domain nuclease of toxin-antitoxin system
VIYLDTHVVAWLHAPGDQPLSAEAIRRIEGAEEIRTSPMVRLELPYLFEIGRVAQPSAPPVLCPEHHPPPRRLIL